MTERLAMTPITASRIRAVDTPLPPHDEELLATLVDELSELRGPKPRRRSSSSRANTRGSLANSGNCSPP